MPLKCGSNKEEISKKYKFFRHFMLAFMAFGFFAKYIILAISCNVLLLELFAARDMPQTWHEVGGTIGVKI